MNILQISKISYQGRLIYFAAASGLGVAAAKSPDHPQMLILVFFFFSCLLFRKKKTLFVLTLLTFIFFTIHFTQTDNRNVSQFTEGRTVLRASFSEPPEFDGNQMKGVIHAHGEKLSAVYFVQSEGELMNLSKQIEAGTSCTFNGHLTHPLKATVPNAFDYHDYLKNSRIHWVMTPDSIKDCSGGASSFFEKLAEYRAKGIQFAAEEFSPQSRGIAAALLFGYREYIPDEINKAYRDLGIIHLLAISGLHVSILVSCIYFILIRSGVTHEWAARILLLLLPVYSLLAGGAPSVLRAAGMSMIYLAVKQLRIKLTAADAISITCIVMLAADPYYLFNIGFQLSFAVSLALLLSVKIISSFSSRLHQLTAVSVIAQASSLPIILQSFYQVSAVSVLVNLLFVPFYSAVVLPLCLGSFLLKAAVPSAGTVLIGVTDAVIAISNDAALLAGSRYSFMLVFGKPSWLVLSLYTVLFCFAAVAFEKHFLFSRLKGAAAAVFLLLFLQHQSAHFQAEGEVVILDVGQGDSIYVSAPYNQGTYLIDTGGILSFSREAWQEKRSSYSIAEDTLVPFLKSKGKKTLDKLILTHGDADHAGEALKLLREVEVKEIVVPKGFIRGDFEKEIVEEALAKGIKITALGSGDVMDDKYFKWKVLSPAEITDSENDDSLVLYAEIGGLKWIFTGDLEHDGEKRILEAYRGLRADVLKIGHHGSKGSTSVPFLQQLQPKIALISAGRKNRYNHPHPDVLKLLEQNGTKTYRTDRDGSIAYKFKGDNGTFSIHPPYDSVSGKEK